MDEMKRFAIYYVPRDGAFADAAAQWLGWDLAQGLVAQQPDLPGLHDQTAAPRKYGFHGTIKPPFRLADGMTPNDLAQAVARLAVSLPVATFPTLQMVNLEGFLALIPQGDSTRLLELAAEVVRVLDPFRAALTPAEIARRKPDQLTPRQRDLLRVFGYPYVLEEFQFHLTLSDSLDDKALSALKAAAQSHFAGLIPQPFRLEDLCLCGEDAAGQFHLLHRYPLIA